MHSIGWLCDAGVDINLEYCQYSVENTDELEITGCLSAETVGNIYNWLRASRNSQDQIICL